jgi:hypothetical protein
MLTSHYFIEFLDSKIYFHWDWDWDFNGETQISGMDELNNPDTWNKLTNFENGQVSLHPQIVNNMVQLSFSFEFILTDEWVQNNRSLLSSFEMTGGLPVIEDDNANALSEIDATVTDWLDFLRSNQCTQMKTQLNEEYENMLIDFVTHDNSEIPEDMIENRKRFALFTESVVADNDRVTSIVQYDIEKQTNILQSDMNDAMSWLQSNTKEHIDTRELSILEQYQLWQKFQEEEAPAFLHQLELQFSVLLLQFFDQAPNYDDLVENRKKFLQCNGIWTHLDLKSQKLADDAIDNKINNMSQKFLDGVDKLYFELVQTDTINQSNLKSIAALRVRLGSVQNDFFSLEDAETDIRKMLQQRLAEMKEAEKLHINVEDFETNSQIVFFRYTDLYKESDSKLHCDETHDPITISDFEETGKDQIVIEIVNANTCVLRCWDVRSLVMAIVGLKGLHPFTRTKISRESMMLFANMVHGSDYLPIRNRENCIQFERTVRETESKEPVGPVICHMPSSAEMNHALTDISNWKQSWKQFESKYKFAVISLVDKCIEKLKV